MPQKKTTGKSGASLAPEDEKKAPVKTEKKSGEEPMKKEEKKKEETPRPPTPRAPIPHTGFTMGSRFSGGGKELHGQMGNPKPMRRSAGRKR